MSRWTSRGVSRGADPSPRAAVRAGCGRDQGAVQGLSRCVALPSKAPHSAADLSSALGNGGESTLLRLGSRRPAKARACRPPPSSSLAGAAAGGGANASRDHVTTAIALRRGEDSGRRAGGSRQGQQGRWSRTRRMDVGDAGRAGQLGAHPPGPSKSGPLVARRLCASPP